MELKPQSETVFNGAREGVVRVAWPDFWVGTHRKQVPADVLRHVSMSLGDASASCSSCCPCIWRACVSMPPGPVPPLLPTPFRTGPGGLMGHKGCCTGPMSRAGHASQWSCTTYGMRRRARALGTEGRGAGAWHVGALRGRGVSLVVPHASAYSLTPPCAPVF